LTASCSGVPLLAIKICPNFGSGSGGANASTRIMASGTDTLNYQLYSSNGAGSVWGSYLWPYTPRPPRLQVSLGVFGTGSTTATIYGRIPAGQTGADAGSYTSTFSSGHVAIDYAYGSGGNCNTALSGAQTARPTFTVRATVQGGCQVDAPDFDFGTPGVLDAPIDTSNNLSVTCPVSTPYSVSLGAGSAGAGPTARTMKKGSEAITYGLYRNTARTLPWGDTSGATVAGTGSGAAQSLPVYGRVPAQSTPSAGVYTDTVVVTVTY
jgi:spore coat protein U-like protein